MEKKIKEKNKGDKKELGPQCGREHKGIIMFIYYLFNKSSTQLLAYYLLHFQFYKTAALRYCVVACIQEI